jgi:hypothetical protein
MNALSLVSAVESREKRHELYERCEQRLEVLRHASTGTEAEVLVTPFR